MQGEGRSTYDLRVTEPGAISMKLTDHELRILRYLEKNGPTNREEVVNDLASPESRIGRVEA